MSQNELWKYYCNTNCLVLFKKPYSIQKFQGPDKKILFFLSALPSILIINYSELNGNNIHIFVFIVLLFLNILF